LIQFDGKLDKRIFKKQLLNPAHMRNFQSRSTLSIIIIITFLYACKSPVEWTNYGGNKANNHYSSLAQIDTNNVSSLKKAWEYHTGDADDKTQIQVNPLIIDGILYGVSPKLKMFALDAATGKELWVFNPAEPNSISAKGSGYFSMNVCRGLT
jgi:quinoprotein glucose dehydrogenase